ncbi:MAG: OmpA family protein [Acidimicrobiia bacterium]|nr:OmpA family protein [Acidimicrobiia bacterium]
MLTKQNRMRLLVVAWLLLVGTAVAVGVSAAQNDLGPKAEQALASAGIDAAVEVSGRDVTITGAASDQEAAETLVGAISGVRVVNFVDDSGTVAAPGATTTTTTSSPPATTQTTAATSTLPPITDEPAGNVSSLEARLEGGQLTLRGTIPSAEAAAGLGVVADLIYAPLLDNQLEVDPEAEPASWVPRVADAIAVLPIVGTSGLTIVGEEATVFGFAPTEERLAQLQGALTQALGPDVTLTSEVEVTGLAPPSINAEVKGDGKITVSGVVPSQEIVEFAIGLAIRSYGEENVVNELTIDPGVDTTFSLFRLPLVFVAFEPFPVWDVQIYDNVISGQLLNGASFPSGSAQLTPQLLQLMPVGAGILTRNPTLVITVEGHTDSVGSAEDNQRLSVARAESARQWFIGAGIDPARVFAVGYGESRPIADNETPEGRAQNRRIEFRLGPPE